MLRNQESKKSSSNLRQIQKAAILKVKLLVTTSAIALLAACSSPPPTLTTGTLVLSIEGLPAKVSADVVVSGSNGFSQKVLDNQTLAGLTPGTYTLTASSVSAQGTSFIPDKTEQDVLVKAGETSSPKVVYRAEILKGSLELTIAGLPEGVDADVSISGPDDFSQTLTESSLLDNLGVGDYTVTALPVSAETDSYVVIKVTQTLSVEAEKTAQVTVLYQKQDPARGSLTVTISGLPVDTSADVRVSGPGGFEQTLSESTTLTDLAAGNYQVSAQSVSKGDDSYLSEPEQQNLEVITGKNVQVAVLYSRQVPDAGTLSITIAGLENTGSPENVVAEVDVLQDNLVIATLTESGTLSLETGSYTVQAKPQTPDSATFAASPDGNTFEETVSVVGGLTTSLRISYSCTRVDPPGDNLEKVLRAAIETATGETKAQFNCDDLLALSELDAFGKGIENLEGLQYALGLSNLNLANNALAELPEGVFTNLKALKVLKLSNNMLTNLPVNAFSELAFLTSLDLSANQLEQLPGGIFDDTSLANLFLSQNRFRSFPSGIFDSLSALATLDLESNELIDLTSLWRMPQENYLLELKDNCFRPGFVPSNGQLYEIKQRGVTVEVDKGFINPKEKEKCAKTAQPPIVSSFTEDTEGWTTSEDAGAPFQEVERSNHFISAMGQQGDTWYWLSPVTFSGIASDYYGRRLEFSLKQSAAGTQFDDIDVVIDAVAFTLTHDLPENPDTDWTSYSVRLVEGQWRVDGKAATRAQFDQALALIRGIRIRGDYNINKNTGSIDDVKFGVFPLVVDPLSHP